MKFTANTLSLQKALVPFNELEFSRGGTDISSMIKLNLISGMLTLSMNIMEKIGMKSTLQVDNSEDGTVCVSYNTLWSYLGTVEAETVSVELKDDNVLTISSDNKQFEIANVSENLDIKTIDIEDKNPAFELSGKDFVRLVRHTIRCIGDNFSRPYMNGVHFYKTDNKLEAAATTGHIVAVSSVPWNKEFEPFTVKKDSLYISQKYLLKYDTVKVYTDEKYSVVTFGNICIQQELQEGDFPNTQKFFDMEFDNKTIISKADFDDTLRIFANITAEEDYPLMQISIENDRFIMNCESSKKEITCSSNSISYEASFDLRNMMNIVSLLDAQELELNYCNDFSKLFEIKINDSDSFRALIVPQNR